MRIPFVGSTYQLEARSFDNQRTINLYPILSESGSSKSQIALRKTAGLELFTETDGAPNRGAITSTSGRSFVVNGQFFYEINSDGSNTQRGTLNTQSGLVSIAENNTQIMIVDGQEGWIFTKAANTFVQITDGDFPSAPVFVTYQDGYFIVTDGGTQAFYISALGDGLVWDALDFTNVESSPDNLVGVYSDSSNLWCFGNRSVEVYQNTGGAAFPFERIGGAIIQRGCASIFTVQKFDSSVAWLGTDEQGQGTVWFAEGYRVRRISNDFIEKKIAEATSLDDAYAFVYYEEGHIFYCLQITGLDTTLCFDGATNLWHERAFNNPETNERERHLGLSYFKLGNQGMIADRKTGKIYKFGLNFYDDAGDEIVWLRRTQHLQDSKRLLTFASLELDMETGRGLATGQGSDPQIMMRYSDDGGRNWSSELWRSTGKVGEYNQRVIWRQLGRGRDRVFEVSGSDPVFYQINDGYINAT